MENEHDRGPESIPPAQPFTPPPGTGWAGHPPPSGPPQWGPPMPGPPPGASGRRSRGRVAGGVAAGVLVLVVLATVVVVGLSGGDGRLGRAGDPGEAAAAELRRAATALAGAAATRYRGMVGNGSGGQARIDLQVTNQGAAHGTMTVDGDELRLLAVDGQTFFEGDEEFWRSAGVSGELLEEYAGHWVKVPPEEFGLDVRAVLAPAELGRAVGREAASTDVTVETTALNGTPAKRVTTARWNVYLAASDPRRILRIETRGFTGGGLRRPPMVPRIPTVPPRPDDPGTVQPAAVRGGGAPAGDTEFQVDLSGLAEQEVGRLYGDLQGKVRELKDSVDSQVRFSLDGSIRLSPCNVNGCTAHVRISNSLPDGGPSPDRPVHAAITITMTLDGRPVRTCRITRTMRPNGSATASCRADYYIPPSYTPRRHTVRAGARAVARPVVRADIDRILRDLRARRPAGPTPALTPAPTPGG
ncbi:hypothetical protein [Thermomonospora amylolytica]|uniref:hypothetical protein n=1 Tax=Thermomonospora amylolytica TaxID=1411117 RepID=UPI0013006F22|nr:hypothetical protein [Thermomonospora amylolytica]